MKHTERRGMWGVPSDFLNTEASNARECVLPLGGGGFPSVPDFFFLFFFFVFSPSVQKRELTKGKKTEQDWATPKKTPGWWSVCLSDGPSGSLEGSSMQHGGYVREVHAQSPVTCWSRTRPTHIRKRKVRCDGESGERQAGLGMGSRNRPSRRASR